MSTWTRALRDGSVIGTLAGLASLVAMAARGQRDNGSALAPVNAPSHWVWGDRALRQDGASWRYTGLGLLVHQASATLWGVLFQRLFVARRSQTRPLALELRDAAIATTGAATVDLLLTPKRFTPGFERRLSKRSLFMVYGGFALGLVVGSQLMQGARRRSNEPA
jgi:hypothetical protein